MGELVGEIAAASNEQAQGIEQVNTAVTEMDNVTQQNAATAEESASASEKMNAQAEQMKSIVDELATLVGGSRNDAGSRSTDIAKAPKKIVQKPLTTLAKKVKAKAVVDDHQAQAVSPEQVIPLDEEDFKDF